ncbi:MAG TPA: hypothetical protein PLH86_00550 [Saprospiraceae bacterium]|nr:hypothetical protein [Saprospiraceae bacterium]
MRNKYIQWILIAIYAICTVIILFPPDVLLFKKVSNYAVHWMMFCLFSGIVFLIFGLNRLLFFCFGASGAISLFLMSSFNSELKIQKTEKSERGMTVLFANPSLSNDDYYNTVRSIAAPNVDIILLEELTPDWLDLLNDLKKIYPYHLIYAMSDFSGKAILSKIPLFYNDTIKTNGNSILKSSIQYENLDTIDIFICNSLPPITMQDYKKLTENLKTLSEYIGTRNKRSIIGANLNIVPWSPELLQFKSKSNFNSSRRDNSQSHLTMSFFGIFNTPKNEILFSQDMDCNQFNIIVDNNENPIGLFGRYYLKNQ